MSDTTMKDAYNELTNLNADISCIHNLLEMAQDKRMESEVFYLIGELKKNSDRLDHLVCHNGKSVFQGGAG